MKPPIYYLNSADRSTWKDKLSKDDNLPIRDSGSWIDKKHKLLVHYANMFATGMKNKWASRVYLELFSGPGRCVIRSNGKEELGSPLKVIDYDFTKFIFTERSSFAADALAQRLASNKNTSLVDIWCGDCSEAIDHIQIPQGSLTFAFIDPTGIAHAPFSLIEKLHNKTRCDLLINIQHGMGIKMNIHQYTPDADDQSALTKFLGNDKWKALNRHNPKDFFQGVLDIYKQQLSGLGFKFIGREVLISTDQGAGLYLLLYATKHPRGEDFWNKSLKGVLDPELELGL